MSSETIPLLVRGSGLAIFFTPEVRSCFSAVPRRHLLQAPTHRSRKLFNERNNHGK
jgi:hypothetical protein